MLRFLALITFLTFSFLSGAEDAAEGKDKVYLLCKNHKQARAIRVHIDSKGQCVTIYSKEGVEKVVGSGKNLESCMRFLENIKRNIEKSGWTCRDISSSHISGSLE